MRDGQMSLFDFMQPDFMETQNTCRNCKHLRTYCDAYTCEPIGTICVKDAPRSTHREPDDVACKDWKHKWNRD